MGKIYVNDVGVSIELDVGRDVREATLLKMYVVKPGGTEAEHTATILEQNRLRDGDIYGNIIYYTTTAASELSEFGTYKAYAYAEWGSGSNHTGETFTFYVYKRGT
jgi:hypothetical protein